MRRFSKTQLLVYPLESHKPLKIHWKHACTFYFFGGSRGWGRVSGGPGNVLIQWFTFRNEISSGDDIIFRGWHTAYSNNNIMSCNHWCFRTTLLPMLPYSHKVEQNAHSLRSCCWPHPVTQHPDCLFKTTFKLTVCGTLPFLLQSLDRLIQLLCSFIFRDITHIVMTSN